MFHYTLRQKLRYHWDNLMARGPVAMLAVLWLATLAMVCLAASVITALGLHPAQQEPYSLLENVWVTLMRTLDPGNVSVDQGWPFRLAMLGVTLAGIFIISALISILSAGLSVKIDDLRKGRSLVVEKEHIVILGWSPKIFTILHELVAANQSRKDSCIVIMAERDKVQMEDELRLKLPRPGRTRIVCRAGNPTDPHDLELVSPQRARALVVLAPEGKNPDAETIKTILALRREGARYHIVAELRDSDNARLARLVGKNDVELVAADDLVARMTVQACRQLGLSLVYTELMDFSGGEMYFHEEPRLLGKTYRECIRSYPHSAVLGVHYAQGKVTVNAPQDYVLQKGDRLVVLAADDTEMRLGPAPPANRAVLVSQPAPRARKPEKILMLGWNDKAPIVIRELDRYMPKGSALTVVSTHDVGHLFDEQAFSLNNLTAEYWTSPTSDRAVLDGLDIIQFQHVMVLAYSDHLDQQEADSQTLMTLLHLRDICDGEKVRVGLLSEMLDIRNRELAEVTHADDFIVSDRLVSMVISQATEDKDVMRVFDDLFHVEGSELFLQPAEHYVKPGAPVTFYDVCEAASERGQTAIGYRLQKYHHDLKENHGLRLNPRKGEAIAFGEGDQIIVLAVTDV